MRNVVRRDSGTSKSTKRRANGEGSVSLRPDGSCDVRVSLPGGQRRRKVVRRLPDESKAQFLKRAGMIAESMQKAVERGHVVLSGHVSVANYSEIWLGREVEKSNAGRGLAPSTLNFYRQVFSLYVNPHLGSRALPTLTTQDVETMMNSLASSGRSPRTIQAARNALSRLLSDARRDGLVEAIVTTDASHVRRVLSDDVGPMSKALEPEQVKRLFEVATGTRWEPILAVLALLGLRRGEALGLTWSDVDLEANIITIRHSLARVTVETRSHLVLGPTKTRSSRRPLALPPVLTTLLRSWRTEQSRQRLKAGQHWGAGWAEAGLVFTTPLGTPIDPDNLRHALDKLGQQAGIGHVHPHQLRHSVASVLIANGHTPPEVAKMLGHSSPSITLNYYAHAFDEASVRAIDTVSDAFTQVATMTK